MGTLLLESSAHKRVDEHVDDVVDVTKSVATDHDQIVKDVSSKSSKSFTRDVGGDDTRKPRHEKDDGDNKQHGGRLPLFASRWLHHRLFLILLAPIFLVTFW